MTQNTVNAMFALLRSAINCVKLSQEELNLCLYSDIQELIDISQKHDVAHILAVGLKLNNLVSESNSNPTMHIINAIYRYEQMKYDYDILCKCFQNVGIRFIPLKGAVIRRFYPEPWMRTSCDIDILVSKDDLDRAVTTLINDFGYSLNKKESYDISLISPNKTHLELHHRLTVNGGDSDLERLLESVWNYASTKNESSCLYEMTDEMYYLYHIAHMAKHFTAGGCGIKPFIDLWLLKNFNNENSLKREELLKKGNLLKFARGVKKTSEIWFGNKEHDVSTQLIENYILNGGTYGICSNAITLNQQKIGSKFKYLLSRIFLPYQSLKRLYPILEKHRCLMPIMQVARWFRTIRNGRFEYSIN